MQSNPRPSPYNSSTPPPLHQTPPGIHPQPVGLYLPRFQHQTTQSRTRSRSSPASDHLPGFVPPTNHSRHLLCSGPELLLSIQSPSARPPHPRARSGEELPIVQASSSSRTTSPPRSLAAGPAAPPRRTSTPSTNRNCSPSPAPFPLHLPPSPVSLSALSCSSARPPSWTLVLPPPFQHRERNPALGSTPVPRIRSLPSSSSRSEGSPASSLSSSRRFACFDLLPRSPPLRRRGPGSGRFQCALAPPSPYFRAFSKCLPPPSASPAASNSSSSASTARSPPLLRARGPAAAPSRPSAPLRASLSANRPMRPGEHQIQRPRV
ncbi:extensin-like [Triticum dicoccoides]|uniref:extensin-like n=1 Tax=Triticum dicoccoides TaxID=85692 RepID=UPI00188FCF7F|nr:extensin-like [Triticum dicoccoides]